MKLLGIRTEVEFVIKTAGIMGLCYGLLTPAIQVAVEQGQVLARVVPYPADNAFFLYQAKAWNIFAQLAALGLRVGLSEVVISLMFSALAGAFAFLGFALIVWAVTQDRRAALMAPFVGVLIVSILAPVLKGYVYPIFLIGSPHTYGVLGLSFMFVCLGLLNVRYYSAAFFVLGLAPSVHPSLSLWTGLAVVSILLLDMGNRSIWLRAIPWGSAGLAITVASYFLQKQLFVLPSPEVQERYLSSYLYMWDLHRAAPIEAILTSPSQMIHLTNTLVISILMWRSEANNPEKQAQNPYLLVGGMCVIIGVVFGVWVHWKLPGAELISILLPMRFLNLTVLWYVAIVIGICWNNRQSIWVVPMVGLTIVLYIAVLAVPGLPSELALLPATYLIPLAILPATGPGVRPLLLFSVLFLILLASLIIGNRGNQFVTHTSSIVVALIVGVVVLRSDLSKPVRNARLKHALSLLGFAESALAAAFLLLLTIDLFSKGFTSLRQTYLGDPFWKQVSEGDNLLLTSSSEFYMTQIKTRRALVFEAGAMDFVPYVPDGLPQMVSVLDEIYGIDYLKPPLAARNQGALPPLEEVQRLWEARSPEEWQYLGNRFKFGQVLTSTSWHLQLPIRAESAHGRLYDLPTD